jgi:hypothetical protein
MALLRHPRKSQESQISRVALVRNSGESRSQTGVGDNFDNDWAVVLEVPANNLQQQCACQPLGSGSVASVESCIQLIEFRVGPRSQLADDFFARPVARKRDRVDPTSEPFARRRLACCRQTGDQHDCSFHYDSPSQCWRNVTGYRDRRIPSPSSRTERALRSAFGAGCRRAQSHASDDVAVGARRHDELLAQRLSASRNIKPRSP